MTQLTWKATLNDQHDWQRAKRLLLVTAVALSVCLTGCNAVADHATGTEGPTAPSPSRTPNYSISTGFGQPDSSITTPFPLENKTPRDDINVTLAEQLLIDELNEYRSMDKLHQLAPDSRLAVIARNHSYDMATRGFFSHENPSGEKFPERLRKYGYDCLTARENIHHGGWMTDNVTTESELAYETILAFMESAPHNEAMLVPRLTTVGIGIYVTADGHVYVTMMLCR